MKDTSIFVGCLNDVAWVRIEGDATRDTSGGLRRYLTEAFEKGLRKFIIDLEQCRLIDSTFIGILSGLASKIARQGDGADAVQVIHTNERNEKSICKLGLNHMITVIHEGLDSEDLETEARSCLNLLDDDEPLDKTEKASMILRAHEELCAANEENMEEFRDVVNYLRKDLENSTSN